MFKTIRSWFTKKCDVPKSPFVKQVGTSEQVFEIIPESDYTIAQVTYLLNRGDARLVLNTHNVVMMGDMQIAKVKIVSRIVHHAPRYCDLMDLHEVRDCYVNYENE